MAPTRIVIMLAALCAVVLTGCAEGVRTPSGSPTAPATIGAFDLRVGDCTGPLPTGSITTLTLIPCAQAHNWEAFHPGTLTDKTYPGQAKIYEDGTKLCAAAFTTFVGRKPEKSSLKFTFFYPTQDTWENTGDRAVLCIVGSPEGGLVGSAKDSKK